MQAIPALFAALAGGAGAAAATTAAATAATASTLATISTGLQVVGAVAGLASASSQAGYQARVAQNNAQIAQDNAAAASAAGQQEAEQRGIMAAVEMGELLNQQSASGLNLGSGSYALARKSQANLASRDSAVIAQQSGQEIRNFQQQAADFQGEASQAKASKRFAFLEAGLNVGTSLVSGATRVNKIKARQYS